MLNKVDRWFYQPHRPRESLTCSHCHCAVATLVAMISFLE